MQWRRRHPLRAARWWLAGFLCFSICLLPGPDLRAKTSNDRTETVWCLDEARAIVRQMQRWRCKGRVVSDKEAKAVKDARVRRIQRALQRDLNPAVPGKRLVGTGTGFFISREGHVLTNHHVIARCEVITVTPPDAGERIAQLHRGDSRRDLALLTTGRVVASPASFRTSGALTEGEPITVVGYPEHGKVAIKPIQVEGFVRAEDNTRHPHIFALQVPVRRGNSGGPVLDAAGQVIGVVFAKVNTPAVYKRTGEFVKDVAYGLHLEAVRQFLARLAVNLHHNATEQPLTGKQRFQRAHEFIVQIGCWR